MSQSEGSKIKNDHLRIVKQKSPLAPQLCTLSERINGSRLTKQIHRAKVCDAAIDKGGPRKSYADDIDDVRKDAETAQPQSAICRSTTASTLIAVTTANQIETSVPTSIIRCVCGDLKGLSLDFTTSDSRTVEWSALKPLEFVSYALIAASATPYYAFGGRRGTAGNGGGAGESLRYKGRMNTLDKPQTIL
ncbi:hypothetical protein EVAR_36553_1 [Eumeta japonica]|uniref:Uncharacterized protein n=1 Tax=Eumeta variegata TaxID=151549 RepID=A0A4C1XXT7_EUMVA|nr:hypothetical protein EVAR_36553_1 [Eumeta japonica]